jgi:hypothetical protein
MLFLCFTIKAQDSLAVASREIATIQTNGIQVDNSAIKPVVFDKNFKKKYTDQAFVYEYKIAESNSWERFKEWLSDFFSRLFNIASHESSSNMVDWTLTILAIGIVLYVIYMITKALMNKEGQWIFGKNSDKSIINYAEIEKNIHLVDFEKLIKGALEKDEKRLSIRYYYLWLLKKMAEKHIIEWDIEKTNSDYQYEIKNEVQRQAFAYHSYLYNYIWYGEFELDQDTFSKAKNTFEKAIKTLKHE